MLVRYHIESPYATFMLVNNTNLHPRSTVFQASRSGCQIIVFRKGVPLVNAFVIGRKSLLLLKSTFSGLHFVAVQRQQTG